MTDEGETVNAHLISPILQLTVGQNSQEYRLEYWAVRSHRSLIELAPPYSLQTRSAALTPSRVGQ